jgi:hypothetical protein
LNSNIDIHHSCSVGMSARQAEVPEADHRNTDRRQNRVQTQERAPCTSEAGSCCRNPECTGTLLARTATGMKAARETESADQSRAYQRRPETCRWYWSRKIERWRQC